MLFIAETVKSLKYQSASTTSEADHSTYSLISENATYAAAMAVDYQGLSGQPHRDPTLQGAPPWCGH